MTEKEIRSLPRASLIANLACIPDQSPQSKNMPSECKTGTENFDYTNQMDARHEGAYSKASLGERKNIQDKINYWLSQNSQVFRWKIKEYSENFFVPELDCIQPINNWIKNYQYLLNFTDEYGNVTGHLYSWGFDLKLDSELNFVSSASAWKVGLYKVNFHPQQILNTGRDTVSLTTTLVAPGKEDLTTSVPVEISLCEK